MYKRIFAVAVLFLSLLSMTSGLAYGDGQPLIVISSAEGQPNDTVTITLTGSNLSSICGGGFDIVYDTDRLQAVSAEAGQLIQSFSPVVNLKYGGGSKVRVTWAGIDPLKREGTLLTLKLRIKDGCQPGKVSLSIDNLRLYDGSSTLVPALSQAGSVAVKHVNLSLRVDMADDVLRLSADLSGDLRPSGGSFSISYDSDKLKPVSAATGLLLSGNTITDNLNYSPDTVRLSWAKVEPVTGPGELCCVYFHVKSGVSGTAKFSIKDLKLYDSEGRPLYATAHGAEIDIEPSSASKANITVARLAAEKKAKVVVSLNQGSMICGGSLTVSYDKSKLKLNSATAGPIIENKSPAVNPEYSRSEVRLSWADALPLTEGGTLLTLDFDIMSGACGFAEVGVSDMKMYGKDAEAMEITAQKGGVYIGKPELVISRSECDFAYFYLSCFNYGSQTSKSFTAVAALYDGEGRMLTARILDVPSVGPNLGYTGKIGFKPVENAVSYKIIFVDDLKNKKPLFKHVEGRLER